VGARGRGGGSVASVVRRWSVGQPPRGGGATPPPPPPPPPPPHPRTLLSYPPPIKGNGLASGQLQKGESPEAVGEAVSGSER